MKLVSHLYRCPLRRSIMEVHELFHQAGEVEFEFDDQGLWPTSELARGRTGPLDSQRFAVDRYRGRRMAQ